MYSMNQKEAIHAATWAASMRIPPTTPRFAAAEFIIPQTSLVMRNRLGSERRLRAGIT